MRVHFTVLVDSPLRIGSGLPSASADDTVVRAADGRPILPATTLKGAVRAAAASATPALAPGVLTRTFGRPDGAAAQAVFLDAAPRDGQQAVVDEVARVSLSSSRTARRGRLFNQEVVLPFAHTSEGLQQLVFEGAVHLLSPDDTEVLQAVVTGLARVEALGAENSRGRGQVRVAIDPRAATPVLEGNA